MGGSSAGPTDGQVNAVHDEEHPQEYEKVKKDVAIPGMEDEDVGMEADVNPDADADADDDGDAEGHVDADKDTHNDEEADSDAEAADADDIEDNVSVSHADTETAASERQHSVAATPEPSNESSKGFEVDRIQVTAHDGSKSKANGAKIMAGFANRPSCALLRCHVQRRTRRGSHWPEGFEGSSIEDRG